MFPIIAAIYFSTVVLRSSGQNGPIVQTKHGAVQGFSVLNNSVDIFVGIPFARPPLGALRFERPREPYKWNTTLNATVFPPGCYSIASNDSTQFSEDCLYVNVYSPHTASGNVSAKLPVLVLIYGGGFEFGSMAGWNNYSDIGTNFVLYGIVVASIQYRVGELGFASTGDGVMMGNMGLFDQTLALKWLVANIAQFGGDPGQITLLGQSAGSASVSALGLSPYSRDLFQRAIQMSGSGLSSWVYGSRVVNETLLLAETFNCTQPIGGNTSQAIKQCLQNKTPTALLNAVTKMGIIRAEANCVIFGPRFDGDFFPKDPLKLIDESPPKPTLQSFTQLEGLATSHNFSPSQDNTLYSLVVPNSRWSTWGASDLRDFIAQHVTYTDGSRFGADQGAVADRIYDFYVNGSAGQLAAQYYNGSTFYIHQYTELIGDLNLVIAIIQEIQRKADLGWPMYMYVYRYFDPQFFYTHSPPNFPIQEATHVFDLDYVFYTVGDITYPMTANDLGVQAFMREAFRNFIKTGNPSTTSASIAVQWPQVGNSSQMNHVSVNSPKPVQDSVMERYKFWVRLMREYPQFNLWREIKSA